MKRASLSCLVAACLLAASAAQAEYTNHIMLTGYWPPTNEMIRHFSTNPEQNPDGWAGEDWEGRGYDIYSFFPEFPEGLGQGEGDFEVDYQDTSEDFWRIVAEVQPIAMVTFGRGSIGNSWELEWRARNLDNWINDYEEPTQPTPSPPDPNVPAGYIRYSTLPMQSIVSAVNACTDINVNAFIDFTGNAGRFLCEYIAYHGMWYQNMHGDPKDPCWNISAGHIHVGTHVGTEAATIATEITLRELISHVDSIVPEPGSAALLLMACAAGLAPRRR